MCGLSMLLWVLFEGGRRECGSAMWEVGTWVELGKGSALEERGTGGAWKAGIHAGKLTR